MTGGAATTATAAVDLGEPLPRRHVVMAVVAIALMMASVDQTIVATALSDIQRDLGATVNWSTWTITVYALGQILALPLAGRLSDQLGRKRVFLGAVALFTTASLLCGLTTDIYELVALRALQSLGGGAFIPSATGIVSDHFGRDRDRAVGLFTSIFPIGGMLGPVLGGVFVATWSWRGIFLVNVPLGVLLLVLGGWLLPRHERREEPHRADLLGILLLVLALLGVMGAVSVLGSDHPHPIAVVGPAALGLTSGALFVVRSTRVATPFIPLHLLRGRTFAVMNGINVLSGAVTVGFSALLPLYAVNRYGLSTLSAGTLLTARAVGTIVVAGTAAFLIRRTGYRWPMRVGFLVIAVGMFLLASRPLLGLSSHVWLAASAGLTGLGMGVMIPANNNAGLDLEPGSAGSVAGIRAMFRQIGGITSVSVISAVVARTADPGLAQAWAFAVFGVVLLAVVPAVSLVPERVRPHLGGAR